MQNHMFFMQRLSKDLINAARLGDATEVTNSLYKGADVNSHNQEGHTALSIAAIKGHSEIVKFLLDNAALPPN